MGAPKAVARQSLEDAITERIGRFAQALASSIFVHSDADLGPILAEVDVLLASSCILERLVFTRNVLDTPGVPRALIDRLLADNFLVARMLSKAGYGLDDDKTLELLASRDDGFRLDVASRNGLSERITDYLLAVGGEEVAYRLASNTRARLSRATMLIMVERAGRDARLMRALAARRDLAGTLAGVTEDMLPETASRPARPGGLGATAPVPKSDVKPHGVSRKVKIINHR